MLERKLRTNPARGRLEGGPDKFEPGHPNRLLGIVNQVSRSGVIHTPHDPLGAFIRQSVQRLFELLRGNPRQLVHRALLRKMEICSSAKKHLTYLS